MTSRRIPADELRAFAAAVFAAMGVPEDDARIAADVLLAADLKGIDSHGIGRLKYYADRLVSGITRTMPSWDVARETPATAVVDAGLYLGHPVAHRAMTLAMAKAQAHDLGAVAVRNSTHFGIAGYYAQMAAEAGMIGLVTTNARPAVAPTFSVQPMLGTNPIAFAAPSDEAFPFLFDASPAVTQRGRIEVMAREGRDVPPGLAVDGEGTVSGRADELLRKLAAGSAALLPLGGAGEELGGHKGFGLSVVVEILSAALQQGDYLLALAGGVESGEAKPYSVGHFFLALRIDAFAALPDFRKTVGGIQRQLRAARKAPGASRVWTPGEKEWECMLARKSQGIPVGPELQKELEALRHTLGLDSTLFPL
jgi:L-2-hydroxycarboxylate dehydrogenase (NAD+)